MNDWSRKCSTCRYANCPAPQACYCDMEREAAEEVRNSMRMIAFVILYAALMGAAIAFVYFF